MDKRLLAHLNDAERLLFDETEPAALAPLDEDAVVDLHRRIRKARNKYTGLYRRQARERVSAKGARGAAHGASEKNRARAEVFEEALARVSRRLGVLARESAAELRTERLALARAGRSSGPHRGAADTTTAEATSKKATAQPRAHEKKTGGVKRDAATRASGARRQAKRDAR